ncbi:MAG TPA: FecR domain-containing protein [Candidatus Cloacimonadota bacterium]|nr:FecR domain-containing protein [Candidatus Cloacimonadota bacterium]HPT72785.1 FecR domain-containing protein [Candidatus Cloacimonadota bacterium]
MKRLLIIFILLFVLAAFLFAENPIAVLVKVKGDITLLRNTKKLSVKAGEVLYHNDKIQSGNASYAALKYIDNGAYLKIFPNTIVSIKIDSEKGLAQKSATIEKGTVFSSINNKIKAKYKVESPTTVASVKGTKYISSFGADQIFFVYTTEGVVEAENLKSHTKMDVPAGSMLQSNPDGSMVVSKFSQLPNGWDEMLKDTEGAQKYKIELQNSYGVKKYIIIETE